MTIETQQDITALKRIGHIVALTMHEMQQRLRPGMTTAELDHIGAAVLRRHGARSAPQITYGFPAATCISLNAAAAHGVPGDQVIQSGDLVNIDVSAELDGYFADAGASFPVSPVSPARQKLCEHGRRALRKAIGAARGGQRMSAIGRAIERVARQGNYNVIRELQGHGVGRALHEEPHSVPSYYSARDRRRLSEGAVITLEPFLTPGVGRVREDGTGWTLRTIDGALSVQYEHTVIITRSKPVVVTTL